MPSRLPGASTPLLMQHKESSIDIDLTGRLSFDQTSVDYAVIRRFGQLDMPLPCGEDLLIVKVAAHRPQDMLDVQALAVARGQASP